MLVKRKGIVVRDEVDKVTEQKCIDQKKCEIIPLLSKPLCQICIRLCMKISFQLKTFQDQPKSSFIFKKLQRC